MFIYICSLICSYVQYKTLKYWCTLKLIFQRIFPAIKSFAQFFASFCEASCGFAYSINAICYLYPFYLHWEAVGNSLQIFLGLYVTTYTDAWSCIDWLDAYTHPCNFLHCLTGDLLRSLQLYLPLSRIPVVYLLHWFKWHFCWSTQQILCWWRMKIRNIFRDMIDFYSKSLHQICC